MVSQFASRPLLRGRFSFLAIIAVSSSLVISCFIIRMFLSKDSFQTTDAAPVVAPLLPPTPPEIQTTHAEQVVETLRPAPPEKIDTKWHPPIKSKTNDLEWVLSGPGTDGKIYDSSSIDDSLYGAYNYCNMPHVRRKEYPGPPEEGMQLEYLEIIHRHHKRTPYHSNTFPEKEVENWDCSEPGRSYMMCVFPQVTRGGIIDSVTHGKDLFAVYHDKLGFIPKEYDPKQIRVRVTHNPLTPAIARAIFKGIYPDAGDKIELHRTENADMDTLEPRVPCTYANKIRDAYQGYYPPWKEHLDRTKDLWDVLDDISRIPRGDWAWHSWFDHWVDFSTTKTCDGRQLPCGLDSGKCLSREDFEKITRLGNYEYSYIYRDAENSLEYSRYRYGMFISEVLGRMQDVAEGKNDSIKYTHNSAHDLGVAAILGFFQLDSAVWPGMGAEIVFELWSDAKKGGGKDFYVRMLWGGQPFVSMSRSLGKMNMVKLDIFTEYVETLTGKDAEDVFQKCEVNRTDFLRAISP